MYNGPKLFEGDYTHESLVERAMRNAKPRNLGPAQRWVAVMDTFATGSTMAWELCKRFGLDPEEVVAGVHCPSCNQ